MEWNSKASWKKRMEKQPTVAELQKRIAELEEKVHREKLAKDALREQEMRYRAIVDQATSDALLVHDFQGRFLEVNRRACESLGYSKEELLRMSVTDVELDFDLQSAQAEWSKIEPGVPYTLYGHQKRKDGSAFPVEIHFGCSEWNGEKLFLGLVRDITERRRTEEALRESEERFRSIVEGAPDAIFIQSDRRFAYLNPAACRLFGAASADELKGTLVLDRIHPQYHQVVEERMRHLNEERRSLRERVELRFLRMDMSEVWVETSGEPIFYQGKHGALGFARDITWRKQAEEALRESDRLKTAFLQNISHEIRTPMNGILGFLRLLEMPALEDDERSEYVRIVNQSGRRLLNTINDIIELSRIEAGRTGVRMESVDVEQVMRFHFNFFEPQAEEKRLFLTLAEHVRGEDALLRTDKNKLDSILNSLLGNAIKFTSKGGVEFGNRIEGSELAFYVRDSGAGIPEDRTKVIFERFMQADSSIARPYEGCGLGLTIAKANVESLGGRIRVSSEPGKGSLFSFSIPYLPLSPEASVPEAPGSEKNEEGPLILIAEDDPISFRFMESVLKKAGYALLHAVDGEEALRAASEHPGLALVLMDLKMPRMDGFEATRRIRRIDKDIPIIAQSAYAFPDDRQKALEAGCDDYLVKPVDRTFLLNMVKRYCEEKGGGGKDAAGERRT